MKTLKNYREKNEVMCERTHIQNHVYANKSKRTYICEVSQMSNPGLVRFTFANLFEFVFHNSACFAHNLCPFFEKVSKCSYKEQIERTHFS